MGHGVGGIKVPHRVLDEMKGNITKQLRLVLERLDAIETPQEEDSEEEEMSEESMQPPQRKLTAVEAAIFASFNENIRNCQRIFPIDAEGFTDIDTICKTLQFNLELINDKVKAYFAYGKTLMGIQEDLESCYRNQIDAFDITNDKLTQEKAKDITNETIRANIEKLVKIQADLETFRRRFSHIQDDIDRI